MGDQLYSLVGQTVIQVEPVGLLASEGWMPGTWVSYSTDAVSYSGAMACVDKSDGTGLLAGMLKTGPQHNQAVVELSDMWTTDTRQREGGDTHADLSSFDASAVLTFDENGQLKRMGSRIAALCISGEGVHKFYVFETENLAKRTTGTGLDLDYVAGEKLYVSDRGLLTSEQETGGHTWTGYVVVSNSSDKEGNYVIVAAVAG